MTDIAKLGIRVKSDEARAASGKLDALAASAGKAEGATGSLTGTSSRFIGVATRMLGVLGGAAGIVGMLRASAAEGQKFDTAMRRLQGVLTATGGVAGRTATQLRAQAQELARATLASTEGILQAQTTLLSFRQISGDVFDATIKAALDLSEAMGTDLNSATLQLAKALENPTEGLSALTRSGTVFTAAQKDMVKAMVEAGDIASAQRFILAELEAQYGGTAEAASGGLAGAQDGLRQSFQELRLAISDGLGLVDLLTASYAALDRAIQSLLPKAGTARTRFRELGEAAGAARAAHDALNRALGVFAESAAPAAGAAALQAAYALEQEARAALAAADAHLVLERARAGAEAAAFVGGSAADAFEDADRAVGAARRQVNEFTASIEAARQTIESLRTQGVQLPSERGEPVVNAPGSTTLRPRGRPSDIDFGYNPATGGGGGATGGGAAIRDEFADRLQELQKGFEAERAAVDAWYADAQTILQDRRAMEILGEEQHRAALVQVEELYQQQIAAIQAKAQDQRLADTAGLFGALAGIAQAGGKRLAKAAAAFGAVEATINAYRAAVAALATPGISLWGRFAAYASVLATGLKGVAAIRQAGGIGGGGGGNRAQSAVSGRAQESPQTVIIQGLRPDDLLTGQMVFDMLYQENNNRGRVFQVLR